MADQDFSSRRQNEFLGQALKQRRTQLRFQRQDLAADGGRRNIEMGGRLADRSGAGNFVDISQQPAVQHLLETRRERFKSSAWLPVA